MTKKISDLKIKNIAWNVSTLQIFSSFFFTTFFFILFVNFWHFEYILYGKNQRSAIANHSLQVHNIFMTISKYKRDLEIVIVVYILSSNSAKMQMTAENWETEKTKKKY